MKGDEIVETQEGIAYEFLFSLAWHAHGKINKDVLIQMFDCSACSSLSYVIQEKGRFKVLIEIAIIYDFLIAYHDIEHASI